MSDEGEKTCPLCAEEMDFTDQQLKPCKCGYEICVWCWHHIMGMAEKDENEGRCPACRSPYDKEKVVGTVAGCERMRSGMNVEKKHKPHKAKSKTSEGRKHLSNARVIQRNLVYVVGLPLDFANEDLLHHREYFGQYGKVLKASFSRTAAGSVQQFANRTCGVYIKYSKEEEAVRCIRSIHGFVLDGSPLRACFGSTKYCHAWLRNVPCINPDCLYLHEIGAQDDCFSKDEMPPAFPRSGVQQITGSIFITQRRSGHVLPPPADANNSSAPPGKPTSKTAVNINNSPVNASVSPPNTCSGDSWATHASSNHPSNANQQCSNGPPEQNLGVCNGAISISTVALCPNQHSSADSDTGKTLGLNEEDTTDQCKADIETLVRSRKEPDTDCLTVSGCSLASSYPDTSPGNREFSAPPMKTLLLCSTIKANSSVAPSGLASDEEYVNTADGNMENMCIGISSMRISGNLIEEKYCSQQIGEPPTSRANTNGDNFVDGKSTFVFGMPCLETQVDLYETEDDVSSFYSQMLKDPEVASHGMTNFPRVSHASRHCSISSPQFSNDEESLFVNMDRKAVDRSWIVSTSDSRSRHPENPNIVHVKEEGLSWGRCEDEVTSGAANVGETSISKILSMEFDPWVESLTSPQKPSKFFGKTDEQKAPVGTSPNQSRFSFAREKEHIDKALGFQNFIDHNFRTSSAGSPLGHIFSDSKESHFEKILGRDGFPFLSKVDWGTPTAGHSMSGGRSSVSRSQISAPPGFSVHNKAPPPGFSSQQKMENVLDIITGNPAINTSCLLETYQQAASASNTISNSDIELMDPAILAVGKGTLPCGVNSSSANFMSSYSSRFTNHDGAVHQSFLLNSLPPDHNHGFSDLRYSFSPLGGAYGFPSRVMDQKTPSNPSPFSQFIQPQIRNGTTSNKQWEGWSKFQGGNSVGMAELRTAENLGYSKYYGDYEDTKIQMPNLTNLFNGTYGI